MNPLLKTLLAHSNLASHVDLNHEFYVRYSLFLKLFLTCYCNQSLLWLSVHAQLIKLCNVIQLITTLLEILFHNFKMFLTSTIVLTLSQTCCRVFYFGSPFNARSRTALDAISTVTVLLIVDSWPSGSCWFSGRGSVRIRRDETLARWYADTVFMPRNLWTNVMTLLTLIY